MASNNKNSNIQLTEQDRSKEELHKLRMKHKLLKHNFFWCSIVVLLLACGFGSFILFNLSCNAVITAITNFSTILSIILSISSISYSYSTSHDTAQQFAAIDKTVAQMKENNEEIKNNNANLLKLVIDINKEVHVINTNAVYKSNIESPITKDDIKKIHPNDTKGKNLE